MAAWVLLHNPTFDVDKELCAWKTSVVASISYVLFWLCDAASEFGFPTSQLGASTFEAVCLILVCLCTVVPEVGLPSIAPGTTYCEAVRLASWPCHWRQLTCDYVLLCCQF